MAKKKLEKAAKKAIANAREAVDDAAKAVRKLERTSKRRVKKLDAEVAALTKDAARSAKRIDRASRKVERAAAISASAEELARESEDYATGRIAEARSAEAPGPARADPNSVESDVFVEPEIDPPTSPGSAVEPSFRELRDEAKRRSIPGYSRMNKAALVEALGGS
ncbi:hypothetical protein [Agromyces sp. Marseille-Q5079]|uniref:hypothetical protein n=1 Tax=Agromyces sp. Marseille-Q5079 TaxID=3439059 RepID=UPI003D9CAD5C